MELLVRDDQACSHRLQWLSSQSDIALELPGGWLWCIKTQFSEMMFICCRLLLWWLSVSVWLPTPPLHYCKQWATSLATHKQRVLTPLQTVMRHPSRSPYKTDKQEKITTWQHHLCDTGAGCTYGGRDVRPSQISLVHHTQHLPVDFLS